MNNTTNKQNFHLTPDGPKPCKANRRRCPRGGKHFSNQQEAQRSYEANMEEAAKSNLTMRQLHKSKALSRALRHDPAMVGESFGENGTIPVESVLKGLHMTMKDLQHIVANDSKGRYSFEENGTLIRAVQGHSAKVKINFEKVTPPDVLYHGTAQKFLKPIMEQGLKSMKRQYVHLSGSTETAMGVASRRDNPVLLEVDAKSMAESGVEFFLSKNGVWLVAEVTPEHLKLLS